MLRLEKVVHGLFGKAGRQGHGSVGKGVLAHALSFEEDHGLQQEIVLPGLALHVVRDIVTLHVCVETEDRHSKTVKRRDSDKHRLKSGTVDACLKAGDPQAKPGLKSRAAR
jgi:hypothetical protein